MMKLRLNMVNVKCNYKGSYKEYLCPLCSESDDTTEHLFQCEVTRKLLRSINNIRCEEIKEPNVVIARKCLQIYNEIDKLRDLSEK